MRTVGVEEELLLVDPAGGRAVSRAAGVLGTTPGSADPGVVPSTPAARLTARPPAGSTRSSSSSTPTVLTAAAL